MTAVIKRGDRIVLQLKSNDIFEGQIEILCKNSIELYNIYCQNTNREIDNNLTFYRDEIAKISKVDEIRSEDEEPDGVVEVVQQIKLRPGEYQRIKETFQNYAYVHMKDNVYFDAFNLLEDVENVAVAGFGSTFDRSTPLSLLVMATSKKIFIFDLYELKDLSKIKQILKSQYIAKVVHDGAALYDCLYHKHGISMQNIFDTQVCDNMLHGKKINRNLAECLGHHLNLPKIVAPAMELKDHVWVARPVPKLQRVLAAQLVAYLLILKDCMTKLMMKDFHNKVQEEYTKAGRENDVQWEGVK